jgi:endoglucanase
MSHLALLRRHSRSSLTARLLVAAALAFAALSVGTAAPAGAQGPKARAADSGQQCPEPYSGQRDPSNPLALPTPPGANPLAGAQFFVPGPAHGSAAGAIAQLLGLNPKTMPNDESWATFEQQLHSGPLAARLATDPALASQVAELSKIASQPEAQRFSSYSGGGGPGGVFGQVEKIFCSNLTADPGSVPVINTYFLHASLGGCPTAGQVRAYGPTFRRRVDEMAQATDRRPAVYLLELDAIGSSSCISRKGALPAWEADLRYEMNAIQSLPHTVVYVEGGYSDSNTVRYVAKVLNAIGVNRIRGFFTNDTHENWTKSEVRWNTKISRLTHGAHFIVNSAQNGRGPLLNRHPTTQGVENLCNPPGRGIGIPDTTSTGYQFADAFMWTHPPGNSSGCGGGPPGGVFWPERAVQLAQNANLQFGPGFPSRPY